VAFSNVYDEAANVNRLNYDNNNLFKFNSVKIFLIPSYGH